MRSIDLLREASFEMCLQKHVRRKTIASAEGHFSMALKHCSPLGEVDARSEDHRSPRISSHTREPPYRSIPSLNPSSSPTSYPSTDNQLTPLPSQRRLPPHLLRIYTPLSPIINQHHHRTPNNPSPHRRMDPRHPNRLQPPTARTPHRAYDLVPQTRTDRF
jgi:hypothetical protein